MSLSRRVCLSVTVLACVREGVGYPFVVKDGCGVCGGMGRGAVLVGGWRGETMTMRQCVSVG